MTYAQNMPRPTTYLPLKRLLANSFARFGAKAAFAAFLIGLCAAPLSLSAQEELPWKKPQNAAPNGPRSLSPDARSNPLPPDENYRRSTPRDYQRNNDRPRYDSGRSYDRGSNRNYDTGRPYQAPPYNRPPPGGPYAGQHPGRPPHDGTYSDDELLNAGHRFFGNVSSGLAKVLEYAFSRAGRPNGYILGEEAGGAIIAGLRYGEGILYTKDAGRHKVYWQGPSIGYDLGAAGSKTMVLVYNMRHPNDIYRTFAGVDGSAYFIGGVGITFQTHNNMTLAPIRAGLGLRLGANIGYLKYTRRPTWNPF